MSKRPFCEPGLVVLHLLAERIDLIATARRAHGCPRRPAGERWERRVELGSIVALLELEDELLLLSRPSALGHQRTRETPRFRGRIDILARAMADMIVEHGLGSSA
jgi:hypothetical protein